MKPSKDLGGFVVFDNLERYRMCSYRITCIYSNGRKYVRRLFERKKFNLQRHIYK